MARLYIDKCGTTGVVANHDIRANVAAYMNSEEFFGADTVQDALRVSITYKLRCRELVEEFSASKNEVTAI